MSSWEKRGGEIVMLLASDFKLTLMQAAGIAGNAGFDSEGNVDVPRLCEAVAPKGADVVDALKASATVQQSVFMVAQLFAKPPGLTPDTVPDFNKRVDWALRALNGARQAQWERDHA